MARSLSLPVMARGQDALTPARATDISSTSATLHYSSSTSITSRGMPSTAKRASAKGPDHERHGEENGQGAIGPKDIPCRGRPGERSRSFTDRRSGGSCRGAEGNGEEIAQPPSFRIARRFGPPHPLRYVLKYHSLVTDAPESEAFRTPCAFRRTSGNGITSLQIWIERGRGPRQSSQLLPSAVDR